MPKGNVSKCVACLYVTKFICTENKNSSNHDVKIMLQMQTINFCWSNWFAESLIGLHMIIIIGGLHYPFDSTVNTVTMQYSLVCSVKCAVIRLYSFCLCSTLDIASLNKQCDHACGVSVLLCSYLLIYTSNETTTYISTLCLIPVSLLDRVLTSYCTINSASPLL